MSAGPAGAARSTLATMPAEGAAIVALFPQGLVDGALRLGESRGEVGFEALPGDAHLIARLIDRDRLDSDGRRIGGVGVEQRPQLLMGGAHPRGERLDGGFELLLQPAESDLLLGRQVRRSAWCSARRSMLSSSK